MKLLLSCLLLGLINISFAISNLGLVKMEMYKGEKVGEGLTAAAVGPIVLLNSKIAAYGGALPARWAASGAHYGAKIGVPLQLAAIAHSAFAAKIAGRIIGVPVAIATLGAAKTKIAVNTIVKIIAAEKAKLLLAGELAVVAGGKIVAAEKAKFESAAQIGEEIIAAEKAKVKFAAAVLTGGAEKLVALHKAKLAAAMILVKAKIGAAAILGEKIILAHKLALILKGKVLLAKLAAGAFLVKKGALLAGHLIAKPFLIAGGAHKVVAGSAMKVAGFNLKAIGELMKLRGAKLHLLGTAKKGAGLGMIAVGTMGLPAAIAGKVLIPIGFAGYHLKKEAAKLHESLKTGTHKLFHHDSVPVGVALPLPSLLHSHVKEHAHELVGGIIPITNSHPINSVSEAINSLKIAAVNLIPIEHLPLDTVFLGHRFPQMIMAPHIHLLDKLTNSHNEATLVGEAIPHPGHIEPIPIEEIVAEPEPVAVPVPVPVEPLPVAVVDEKAIVDPIVEAANQIVAETEAAVQHVKQDVQIAVDHTKGAVAEAKDTVSQLLQPIDKPQ